MVAMTRTLLALIAAAMLMACRRADPELTAHIQNSVSDAERPVQIELGDTARLSRLTAEFYTARENRPAWTDLGGLTRHGRAVVSILHQAANEGLNPERYRVPLIERLIAQLEQADDSTRISLLGDLDLLITDGLALHVRDLARGALDPEAVGLRVRLTANPEPGVAFLDSLANGADPAELTGALLPRSPQYAALKRALEPYRGRSLKGAAADTVARILLNLDRWRMLPEMPKELHILVNIAGYELDVQESDTSVLNMRVVVGDEATQTPIFIDTLEHIILNPYWNVPMSIVRNEIAPAMRQDDSYLERNDMEIVMRDDPDSMIDPDDIDWGAIDSASVPWRIRQRPGPRNALGRMKFMLPNEYNIYLHDSPAGALFARAERTYSHGCIRLERPDELARLVLERATKLDPAILDKPLRRGEEQRIDLDRGIPVYILYLTATVKDDGRLVLHSDPYGRDKRLMPQVRERLASP